MLLYVEVTKIKHRIILMDKTLEVQNSLKKNNVLCKHGK